MIDTSYPGYCLFSEADRPGAHSKVYAARILGSHPKFVFRRQFVDLRSKVKDDGWQYWFELDEYGVYECGVSWFFDNAKKDAPPFFRSRTWFVVMDGVIDHYISGRENVLPELRKLKQYIKEEQEAVEKGGDAA